MMITTNTNDGDDKNYIKEFIDELSEKTINHQNYKKDIEKVFNYIEALELNIESDIDQRDKYVDKLEKFFQDKQIVTLMKQDEIVHKDVYETLVHAYEYMDRIFSLKILQFNLAKISLDKLRDAMSVTHSFDIEKETLSRMAEYNNKNRELVESIVNQKFDTMDKRYSDFKENIDMRFQNLQTNIQNVMIKEINDIITKLNNNHNISTSIDISENMPKPSLFSRPKPINKMKDIERRTVMPMDDDDDEDTPEEDTSEEEVADERVDDDEDSDDKVEDFTCKLCGFPCKNAMALKSHTIYHHGEKK